MSLGHQPPDLNAAAPSELIQHLRELDVKMPETFQAQVLAAGSAIAADLLAILEDALAHDEADHGWAPSHAAKLLGALGDSQAVPVLLRFLERYDVMDAYHHEAANALVALGPLALEACLEAYPTTNHDDLRSGIASVLSRSATKDERIHRTLLDFFEQSPELGAIYLAEYGDPRAISALSQMFDALPVNDRDDAVASNHVFVELSSAIERLGGQLTAAQRAKADRADAPRRRLAARMKEAAKRLAAQHRRTEPASSIPLTGRGAVVRKQRKLGRNERCWCGSGKKYKKCHLDQER